MLDERPRLFLRTLQVHDLDVRTSDGYIYPNVKKRMDGFFEIEIGYNASVIVSEDYLVNLLIQIEHLTRLST